MINSVSNFYFIFVIFACVFISLYHTEISAMTESKSKPIIVALARGDVVDKKSLTDLFKKYLTNDDFILPILGDDWNYIKDLPGERMVSAGTIDTLQQKIEKFKGQVN